MATDPTERRLRHADTPIAPRPEFAATLLTRLLAELEADRPPTDDAESGYPRAPQASQRLRSEVRAAARAVPAGTNSPVTVPRTRRGSALVAIAAVLLVAIGLGARMLLPTGPDRPPAIPAMSFPSPTALGLGEILLRIDVAAWNPSTEPATPGPDGGSLRGRRIDLFRIMIEPDAPYAEYTRDLGTRLILVESGAIEVTLDGPGQLLRAGAPNADDVGAGPPVTLEPGDALVTPGGTHRTLRAIDSKAATALQLIEHRWIQKDLGVVASGPQPEMLARGALVVTIARGELAPNGVLPAPRAGAVAIVEVEAGTVGVERTDGGHARSFTYSRGGDVVVGADPAGITELRNIGTEPARLLVVLFEPAN
jgi:quercetin dioxygenase-like cupin family protein